MTRFGQAVSTLGAFRGVRAARAILVASVASLALAACQDSGGLNSGRAWKPIPRDTLALMEAKGTTKHSPILVRAFKKEAELEIWKMKADGTYTHLKTYPVCRWSGQLGPKKREGDRQVPEGFYSVSPGLMNPNSNYYLSFNIGYPNAYDRAHGYTGGLIMVHGDCSSAGCFAMTDEQIAEIYAIAREAFAGGQRNIQVQSMPFRMTPENLARYRLDPNMKFWNEIKEGYDHFEVTKREPQVAFCGRRYVFNATSANGAPLDPNAACPPLKQDEEIAGLVAEKRKAEQAQVAELVGKGVRPVSLKYADGGQHPSFRHVTSVSRPEALAKGPIEIALDEPRTPTSPVVRVASARATQQAANATPARLNASGPASPEPAAQQAATSSSQPAAAYAPETASSAAPAPFYKRWFGLGSAEKPAEAQPAPTAAAPAERAQRGAAAATPQRNVQGAPAPASQPQRTSELPAIIRGAQPVLPAGLMAFTPVDR
ncbi:MAG: L,D-transpeptidase family protein [Beijerinckiaceae bacterium]